MFMIEIEFLVRNSLMETRLFRTMIENSIGFILKFWVNISRVYSLILKILMQR